MKLFKNKKILLYFLIFIFSFIISFVVSYICMPFHCDTSWLFGFSSNINKGLVIYRDFNVITTPLYYFVSSIFLKVFGNYIISMELFNSLLVASMVLMMYKTIKWKAFIVFLVILIYYPNGYTIFALFWLMVILYLINQKKDDETLMGLILGLLFITKQNIGVVLFIPFFIFAKNKLKAIITFLVPFFILSIYLLLNNAFYEFIDYCFLGLFDFGTTNYYYNAYSFIEIFVLIFLVFRVVKSRFKDKEVIYILMFQFVMYPLPDERHFIAAFFPVVYYIVKTFKNYLIIGPIFSIILFCTLNLFLDTDYKIHFEKNIFFLKSYGNVMKAEVEGLYDYVKDADYYFMTGSYGYSYKLYYDEAITKYDLLNAGNHGHKGVENTINEIDEMCQNHTCVFVVNGDFGKGVATQIEKVCDYIVKNYRYVDTVNGLYIYSNYVE